MSKTTGKREKTKRVHVLPWLQKVAGDQQFPGIEFFEDSNGTGFRIYDKRKVMRDYAILRTGAPCDDRETYLYFERFDSCVGKHFFKRQGRKTDPELVYVLPKEEGYFGPGELRIPVKSKRKRSRTRSTDTEDSTSGSSSGGGSSSHGASSAKAGAVPYESSRGSAVSEADMDVDSLAQAAKRLRLNSGSSMPLKDKMSLFIDVCRAIYNDTGNNHQAQHDAFLEAAGGATDLAAVSRVVSSITQHSNGGGRSNHGSNIGAASSANKSLSTSLLSSAPSSAALAAMSGTAPSKLKVSSMKKAELVAQLERSQQTISALRDQLMAQHSQMDELHHHLQDNKEAAHHNTHPSTYRSGSARRSHQRNVSDSSTVSMSSVMSVSSQMSDETEMLDSSASVGSDTGGNSSSSNSSSGNTIHSVSAAAAAAAMMLHDQDPMDMQDQDSPNTLYSNKSGRAQFPRSLLSLSHQAAEASLDYFDTSDTANASFASSPTSTTSPLSMMDQYEQHQNQEFLMDAMNTERSVSTMVDTWNAWE